jgi:hypothetical protein
LLQFIGTKAANTRLKAYKKSAPSKGRINFRGTTLVDRHPKCRILFGIKGTRNLFLLKGNGREPVSGLLTPRRVLNPRLRSELRLIPFRGSLQPVAPASLQEEISAYFSPSWPLAFLVVANNYIIELVVLQG